MTDSETRQDAAGKEGVVASIGAAAPADDQTLTITIRVHADGKREVNAVVGRAGPPTRGAVRAALREALSHHEDLFVKALAQNIAMEAISRIPKDGNRLAKFFSGLRH
jgi:hypothetical protein